MYENSSEHKSTIDFVINHRNIYATGILEIRALNSAEVDSKHKHVLVNIQMMKKHHLDKITVEKVKAESLRNNSTPQMYQKRLTQKIKPKRTNDTENVSVS